MGNVVGREELLIRPGAANFELTGTIGVKPEGRAPAIDELAVSKGIVLAGEEMALLPGVLRAGEGGGDVGIVTEGGVEAGFVDQMDELGHDLEVFMNGLAWRVELAGFVVIGHVDLRVLAGLRSGVKEICRFAEIAELGRRRWLWGGLDLRGRLRRPGGPEDDGGGDEEGRDEEGELGASHGFEMRDFGLRAVNQVKLRKSRFLAVRVPVERSGWKRAKLGRTVLIWGSEQPNHLAILAKT